MSIMSNTDNVKNQYADDSNLLIRMQLHQKYSTNSYDFFNWLFDQYNFFEGCRTLELGCGSASIWENRVENLPLDSSLILSDFSNGMVNVVSNKFSKYSNISFQQIDIQDIPYPDNSFDIIIANHMLYHVPDLHKALSEVYRILKPNGVFYSSTTSNKGMREYLHNEFKKFNSKLNAFAPEQWSFTIENGDEELNKFFNTVKLLKHVDSLKIINTQDLIDWIESAISMAHFSKDDLVGLYDYFEDIRKINGYIEIPKLTGVFISTKNS